MWYVNQVRVPTPAASAAAAAADRRFPTDRCRRPPQPPVRSDRLNRPDRSPTVPTAPTDRQPPDRPDRYACPRNRPESRLFHPLRSPRLADRPIKNDSTRRPWPSVVLAAHAQLQSPR